MNLLKIYAKKQNHVKIHSYSVGFFLFYYLYRKYYMGHFCELKVSSLDVTYLKAQPTGHPLAAV